jgi:hypothetical protein
MWEYKTLQSTEGRISAEQLTELGAQAWELVTIVVYSDATIHYFKRPLASSAAVN